MRCRLISVTSAHLCRCLGLAARSRRLALTARLATLLARFAPLVVCLFVGRSFRSGSMVRVGGCGRCGSSELTSEEIDLLRQASARSAAADGSGGESDKFKKWGKKAWCYARTQPFLLAIISHPFCSQSSLHFPRTLFWHHHHLRHFD